MSGWADGKEGKAERRIEARRMGVFPYISE